MSIDEGVHYEASLDKVRIAYACYHDDYQVKGRTTEQWWGIRDKAMAEFDDWFRQKMADAWDEGAAKGAAYGDTAISLNPMHTNPYREANDD